MEVKEILKLVGVEKDEITPEELKLHLSQRYIQREIAHEDPEIHKKVMGKKMGTLKTKIAQTFGMPHSELDEKTVEEALELGAQKFETQRKELVENATKTADERVKDLEKKVSEYTLQNKALEEGNTTLKTTLEKERGEFKTKWKEKQLQSIIDSARGKVVLTDDTDELKKKGYYSEVNERFLFDYDEEKEKPVVKLRKDGSIVPSKKDIGNFATPEEAFEMVADEFGILKKNNLKTGKQEQQQRNPRQNGKQGDAEVKTSRNPNLLTANQVFEGPAGKK